MPRYTSTTLSRKGANGSAGIAGTYSGNGHSYVKDHYPLLNGGGSPKNRRARRAFQHALPGIVQSHDRRIGDLEVARQRELPPRIQIVIEKIIKARVAEALEIVRNSEKRRYGDVDGYIARCRDTVARADKVERLEHRLMKLVLSL